MYETVLKLIIQKVENDYNIFIPKDIIQLIYDKLNKKHQCAIMIQNRTKRIPSFIPEKYYLIDYMNPTLLSYILIEYISIYDYKVIFYDKDVYERTMDICNMITCYHVIQKNIDKIFYKTKLLEFGLNPNGFFKK